MRSAIVAFLCAVFVILLFGFAEAAGSSGGGLHNCAASAEAAVSGVCRRDPSNGTIAMLDYIVTDRIQSLLKFSQTRYESDWRYRRWIDDSRSKLTEFLADKFDFNDRRSILYSKPPQGTKIDARALLLLFEKFQVQYVGCNFTLEREGDVQISRSFLIAYQLAGKQRFAVIHAEIGHPHKVHEQLPRDRLPTILSFDVRVFAPGYPNSNEILRVHVLPDPAEQCQKIIDLMDQDEVNAIRQLMSKSYD